MVTKKYDELWVENQKMQDLVVSVLYQRGIVCTPYQTQRWQRACQSRSYQGVEITLDRKFRETSNLYIETAEKVKDVGWVSSGCYRANSWLYVIGDTDGWLAIGTKHLINNDTLLDRHGQPVHQHVVTTTSKGYLLPYSLAVKLCIMRYPDVVQNIPTPSLT